MKKFQSLTRHEMKNVKGGITPEMASCQPGAWDAAIINGGTGECIFSEYIHCQQYCTEAYCNVNNACSGV